MSVKIITDEKLLSVVSVNIGIDSPLLDKVVSDLIATAEKNRNNCAGLAANQIGHLFRICLVKVKDEYISLINAEIIKKGGRATKQKESCLSRPNNPPVEKIRFQRVTVFYFDSNKHPREKVFHGFEARVVQHEIDHFEGKLI